MVDPASRVTGENSEPVDQVHYSTVYGRLKSDDQAAQAARVILRVNGYTLAEAEVQGGIYQLNAGRAILATDRLAVMILDHEYGVLRQFNWGASERPLPLSWIAGEHYRKPSLFVLGAAKSATTSLHVYLDQHPHIFMSKPKEPVFFEAEYERGARFYYSKYFGGSNNEPVIGESRHRNLYLPYVPARIHAYNPRAKLLAVLRNPAERAISHWWHWYSRGFEHLSPQEAFEADLRRIGAGEKVGTPEEIMSYVNALGPYAQSRHRTYIDSGYYHDQLERYLQLFSRDQLCVVLFDDLVSMRVETMRRVFEFLDVDPDRAPLLNYEPLNQSAPGMWAHVDGQCWRGLVEHFAPHNRRLEQLLDRSLACWGDSPKTAKFSRHAGV